jgi:hypothetical protein
LDVEELEKDRQRGDLVPHAGYDPGIVGSSKAGRLDVATRLVPAVKDHYCGILERTTKKE